MEINESDFRRLYDEYLPKIYRYAYYRVRHKEAAEDVAQAVFLKVVQNYSSYKDEGVGVGPWIYRIARNTVIDYVRAQKPLGGLDEAVNVSTSEDVLASTDEKLKLDWVRNELKNLSELQQEVVMLRVWDELSHREIADALGISEGNSKINFSRAVKTLKQQAPLVLLLLILTKAQL
jgi:RNA polymerase sigma-70 factor (ECF subfamily)